ncbi:MAG: hypothetical protein KI793_31960 [Rivularia sp. (in: Bacteria)]|nr:hypothetical protein [Rivularia sp. MS3]
MQRESDIEDVIVTFLDLIFVAWFTGLANAFTLEEEGDENEAHRNDGLDYL